MLTVSSKGQITLPKTVRQRLKLRPGNRIVVDTLDDETVTLRRVKDIEEFKGVLAHVYPQDAVTWVRELRDREDSEDRKDREDRDDSDRS